MAIQQVLLAYGSGAVTYTAMNPSDSAANMTFASGNLDIGTGTASNGIVRSVKSLSGKQYFEAVLTLVSAPGTAVIAAGIANATHSLTASLGFSNANGWAYWGTNTGARHNSVTAIANASATGDVLGFAIDVPNNSMWIRKNGTWLQGDPATGTSPIWTDLSGTIYAAACPWTVGSHITMRFDPASFRDAAPTGYSPITA